MTESMAGWEPPASRAEPSALHAEASALRAEELAVRFGGLQAVASVTFDVRRGELVGLIGPNGAGKTTAIRLITGIVRPDRGRVLLAGRDVTALSTQRRARLGLAMTHQLVRPFRGMSVLENVMVAAGHAFTVDPFRALVHVDRSAARARGMALLERVGLAGVAAQDCARLPLGQLKRLEVARALAIEPSVILLDEPLAGLNSAEAAALAETIVAVNREGLTVLLVEHNLGEVLRIAQRLLVLVGGRVVAEGEPRRVIELPHVRDAYIGTADESAAG